jgi:hypothetical protein
MGKTLNKAVLSKAVSRYMAKHYKRIWVRREFHDKVRDAARKVGRSIPEFVYELFNRYGGRLVEELLAEGSKSAQATMHAKTKRVEAPKVEATMRAPKPEVEAPEPGFVVIDLGVYGRFKVKEEDWRLFVEIVESTRDPTIGGVIERLPAHLRGLFRQMLLMPAVKYNVRAEVWMINYDKFRIIRAR